MDSRASDVLKKQRYLAAQTLQKANEMFDRSPLRGNSSSRKYSAHTPPTQDRFADDSGGSESMVQPRQYRSINITELEEEHTIHMQATPQKVSFEPTEMTARSTLDHPGGGEVDAIRRRLTVDHLAPDIQQLLHQSISSEVRELGKAPSSNDSALHLLHHDDRPDVSLPRTADMSRLSSVRDSLTSNPKPDFWDVSAPAFGESWMKKELSQLEDIDFRPADELHSRLLEDEMAWEQEQAIIPQMNAARNSQPQQKPSQNLPKNLKNHVDFSCFSGYLAQEATRIEDSSYCSVGEYFNKMSDDLKGMIPDDQSPPRRTPLPLVDLSNMEPPSATRKHEGNRNKTSGYQGVSAGSAKTTDKENSTLNMSSIMKVINSMAPDESPSAFYEKIRQLRSAKPPPTSTSSLAPPPTVRNSVPTPEKTPTVAAAKPLHKASSLKTDLSSVTRTPSFTRDLSEARPSSARLSDTASFTESLLESSAFVPVKGAGLVTSSPMTAPPSAAKSEQGEGTYRISTAKKPLLETYRVSTATKLSENQLELPPIPMIAREPPKCQKQIFLEVPGTKPNRKRRSSSATRQELMEAQEKHLEVVNEAAAGQKRSRSPANGAELKAVASQLSMGYHETPKSSMAFGGRGPVAGQQKPNKSFLSPEPRTREYRIKSPYSSPKEDRNGGEQRYNFGSPRSVASSVESGLPEFPKSPVSEGRSNLLASAGRSASQCSVAGSEYSHKDGVLPLKATHTEMSWGSTKLRRNAKKVMQIKNTSGKRLVIRASITGPGFQLGGIEQSEMLTLQSQECRTIVVNFCPTVIGPAIGLLSFQPPHDCYAQRVVTLYGFGGEASIKVEGIQKGPSGPFLELGQARNLGRPLEKSFSLYNKGSLAAFARIGIDKKGLDQTFLATAVFVQPQRVIIPPNSYAHIRVTFKPRRQDVAKILQKQIDVLSITNLHILWGDEPTRHRTRKLIQTIKQNELQDRNKITPLEAVCETFPGEHEFNELENFAENMFETMHELFLTFREYELVLTVDRALDETMIDLSLSEDDSSALFKTMIATSEAGSPRLPEEISPGIPSTHSAKRDSGESWSVRPTRLDFRPNERTKQFVIKSNFYTTQFFELNSNYRPFFKFSPMEGQIRPGQEVVVNVNFHMGPPPAQQQHQQPIVIVVYIENEKITIPVNLITRSRPGVGPSY